MVSIEELKKAKYVRYNNKIYSINLKYSNRLYFNDYHLSKLDEEAIDFYIDFDEKKYKNFSCTNERYDTDMYDTILSAVKIVDNPDEEYMACLEDIYRASIVTHISYAEKRGREKIHQTLLREHIYNLIKNQTIPFIYKAVAQSYNNIMFDFKCNEDILTFYGKYPILYKYPNCDGIRRDTYIDYLKYIFVAEFPLNEAGVSIDDHIGTIIVDILKDIWPRFVITYKSASDSIMKIHIHIPIRTDNILM